MTAVFSKLSVNKYYHKYSKHQLILRGLLTLFLSVALLVKMESGKAPDVLGSGLPKRIGT
jgi:hypothetical protein